MEVDQVVAQWGAEELAVRARLKAPGSAPTEQIFGCTGMQVLEGIFSGELPPAPIGETLEGYTTLELKVNMVRTLTDAVPLVRAEGKLIHSGRQVATAEGRIIGPDGRLYAHATTTCLIFDPPAGAPRSAPSGD
jgi:uncharacterized protein (TIGR00369 family)